MAGLSVATPSKKQRLSLFEDDACIFCDLSFSESDPAVTPNITRIESLFNACLQRQDQIGQKLLEQRNQIYRGEINIQYHRNCRSTYTSPFHIGIHKKHKDNLDIDSSECLNDSIDEIVEDKSFTRSKSANSTFEWKKDCFICGQRCNPCDRYSRDRKWSMVETLTEKNVTDSLYTRVLEAAEKRNDTEMKTRLCGVPNRDLVACEARYHRKKNCLAHYIDPVRIARMTTPSKDQSLHKKTLEQVISEFSEPIVKEKQVFPLETLKSRFLELARENNVENPESYSTQHLKGQFMKIWPDISFISHSGLPDLVCSKEITVSDALRKAHGLSEIPEYSNLMDEDQEAESENQLSEERIVHAAVGILRRRMKCTTKLTDEYYSSTEMSLEAAYKFVDPLLYKAIAWLGNKELYDTATDIPRTDIDKRCVSIACDITTLNTAVVSPKHLGLSIHMYHEYGSRKLIDRLYALGYGISYTELRQFLTSAAIHVTNEGQSLPSGAIVPPTLPRKDDGGRFIIAAADNWDHNERTPDGRGTTHAMTSILISDRQEDVPFPRIQRSASRSYDVEALPGK